MNLRGYYKRLRETESAIEEPFPVIVSLATPDGGKAGQRTEVSRALAARMITDGLARLATSDELKPVEREKPSNSSAKNRVG
ncbi:MAG: hypothetical protein JO323_02270 [Acidobacteriia bacterium]|nr:hypothetical protein [Terriglobia bacterium]